MTVMKTIIVMCMILLVGGERGCQSSVEITKELDTKFPVPTADEQAELDEILNKWQANAAECSQYSYRFRGWEYDSTFGPKDAPRRYEEGSLRLAMPNRWHYRVDKVMEGQPGSRAGRTPSYSVRDADCDEMSWDGEWLSEASVRDRRIVRSQFPIESRSTLCPEIPLPSNPHTESEPRPFLALADHLRWLGQIDVADLKHRYRFCLSPTKRDDGDLTIHAISRVHGWGIPLVTTIFLDRESYLPKGLILRWSLETAPDQSAAWTTYQFIEPDPRVRDDADFQVPVVSDREGWTVEINRSPDSRDRFP